ncbi:MAG: ferrous iron transport protein A [Mitsuaria chitosanitabida]|jgi:ferrous iron transport protein A|uniref:FeoA family protein n=1 Tax=Roseateles chitosanitabidus TaxID=65048 RepID=UPI001B1D812F|nr:FeoA family protein [Roseateles chitosanitabidus]MBO9685191.1 ferrous iron transport protein A [Roseateles chitosanitabidus]
MSAVLPVPTLAQAAIGQAHRVKALEAPAHAPEWKQWLEELGFVPGEHVAVLARAMPGADPLVVRIGQSTFALRRAEADCVQLADGSQDGLTVALPTGAAHA